MPCSGDCATCDQRNIFSYWYHDAEVSVASSSSPLLLQLGSGKVGNSMCTLGRDTALHVASTLPALHGQGHFSLPVRAAVIVLRTEGSAEHPHY